MGLLSALFGPGSLLSPRRTPALGNDLPRLFAEAEPIFDARLKALFPVGTSEDDVVRALEQQGFVRATAHRGIESATFTRQQLIMKTIWSARWRSTKGRIDEIWGVHGAIAP